MGRSLEGKVALVTGASKGGTGTGTAVRFAAEGAKVGITARSEDGLKETMARIEAVGGEGLMMQCDLGDPDGGRATLVARTEEAFGPLDILVNNAVAHTLKPVHEFTIDELALVHRGQPVGPVGGHDPGHPGHARARPRLDPQPHQLQR